MTPYWTSADGRHVIYLGDCRDILPHIGKVDLVITDPPYGMMFQSNHRLEKHSRITGDDCLPVDTIRTAIDLAENAAYVFCRWDNLNEMPKPRSVIAWVKNNWSMGDLKHEHGRQWEAICFYPRNEHEFVSRIPDVIHCDRTGNVFHPTEKPVDLIREIIRANVAETVLDPFMGSGSAGVACEREGRKFIGIECEKKYVKTAIRRIEEAMQTLWRKPEPDVQLELGT